MLSSGVEATELIQVSVTDHVATVALNRPQVLNAVTTPFLERLIDVFDEINDDPQTWCVVLKGNGRAFCVGADQKERPTMSHDAVRRRRRIAPAAFSAMRRCIRPVIGQIHGYALGSGLELALGCDVIVASADTVLGVIETRLGAIPGGGATQLLPRLVGPLRARELILTGRRFTAADAADWGLFNYVLPAPEVEAKVRSLAEEIVACAPIANAQAKKALTLGLDVNLDAGLDVEAALYERTLTTQDRAEALKAYSERRKPVFRNL